MDRGRRAARGAVMGRLRQTTDIQALRRRRDEVRRACGDERREVLRQIDDRVRSWQGGRTRRVLIIEDDDGYGRVLAEAMEHHLACETRVVRTAAEALHDAEIEDYDLIITDLILPGDDGAEFVRRVRTGTDRPLVPLVMISSFHEEEVASIPVLSGASAFVCKDRGLMAIVSLAGDLLAATCLPAPA